MPTNVTPEYRAAEAKLREAKTPEEKITALEEMLRVMPKHKGTDHLQADVKARIAKLKRAEEKKPGGKSHGHTVPREGAGQVALVGPPNSGKSSLLARLTHAEPKIAPFPFTTREPLPGMMPFEDVAIQLVDLPAVAALHVEAWVFDCIRRADILWIVVDQAGSLEGWEETRRLLAEKHVFVCPPGGDKEATAEKTTWPAFLVVTGRDQAGSEETLAILAELVGASLPVIGVSSTDGRGLEDLRRRTYEALDVIRVYTKEPGKEPDHGRPFVLARGACVLDLAHHIHHDLALRLKFARLWGKGVFEGQPVTRDHVLADGDVVEIHTR